MIKLSEDWYAETYDNDRWMPDLMHSVCHHTIIFRGFWCCSQKQCNGAPVPKEVIKKFNFIYPDAVYEND